MKTKAIIGGMVVAAISTFIMSNARAQGQDVPAVKIVSTDRADVIKVIYAYDVKSPVAIKFRSAEGLVYEERLTGRNIEKGFSKRYDVNKLKSEDLWIDIDGQDLSVTFKMAPSKAGKWSAKLEKVSHNASTLALN